MLKVINVYQILACVVGLFFITKPFIESFPDLGMGQLFIGLLFVFIISYCFFTNILLLIKPNNNLTKYLKFNIWFNLLQVVNLVLFGLTYKIGIGVEIIPYIVNEGFLKAGLSYDIFNVNLAFYYNSGMDGRYFGINLVPLIITIILIRILKGMRASNKTTFADEGANNEQL